MMQPDFLFSFKRVGVRGDTPAYKSFLRRCCCHCIWLSFFFTPVFKKAAQNFNEPGKTEIKLCKYAGRQKVISFHFVKGQSPSGLNGI